MADEQIARGEDILVTPADTDGCYCAGVAPEADAEMAGTQPSAGATSVLAASGASVLAAADSFCAARVARASAGADIIFHAAGGTGRGVFEAARDMGVKAIGVDSDQYDEMPEVVLSSMVKRVDVVVLDVIRQTKHEQFEAGLRSFGLREDAIDYGHEGPHAAGIPTR